MCGCVECAGRRENEENHHASEAVSVGAAGYAYKGWVMKYNPHKPIPPGVADWEASHPDEEELLTGQSLDDLRNGIDIFTDV